MKEYRSKSYLIREIKTKTYSQIALENNVNLSTIFRNLKKLGLTKTIKKWKLKELDLLKNEYPTNRGLLNKFENRSLSAIYHKASHFKIHRLVKPLKYKIDEEFFNIWSKELAYFLGFFMADGHISLKRRIACIKLQRRDQYILSKFLELLKTNRKLKYSQGYPTFIINNQLIIKRLVRLGCKPSNSLNNSYPKEMPNKYFFHFLRGYIDGDGSIYICKSKRLRQKEVLRVTILGSKKFLKFLTKKIGYSLNKKIDYTIRRSYNTGLLYNVTFNSELARRLCYRLYEECEDLYIKRKREKFDEHIKCRI